MVATFTPFAEGKSSTAVFFAEGKSSTAVFDQSDAFYLPVAGFDAMIRPGPEIAIYRVEKRRM